MKTRSLLWWMALLGGAELAVRGHLWNQGALFQAGVWLAAVALLLRGFRAAALVPLGLSLLAAVGVPGRAESPVAAFWRSHAEEREALARVAHGDTLELFGTKVAVDAGGFRMAPVPPEPVYRIVAIGGSNTFGVPRPADEPPWPERLEREIGALGCQVPVSVVNAGRTGRGLPAAVRGFESEILPLSPDLILVYPSPADLFGVARALPAGIGVVHAVPDRASSLLAWLEVEWGTRRIARRYREALVEDPASFDPDDVPLADAYRRLLVESRQHGIDVALSNLSLAIDATSSEAEVRRYEASDPRSRHAVIANRIHDRLVREIGASFRAIPLDSKPDLDGTGAEMFLDLVHLNGRGRDRLAENLLHGLRARLASLPRPGCAR